MPFVEPAIKLPNARSARLAGLPMNERLSTTSAGGGLAGPASIEGRERGDLEVLRDHWVRSKARIEALGACKSKYQTLR